MGNRQDENAIGHLALGFMGLMGLMGLMDLMRILEKQAMQICVGPRRNGFQPASYDFLMAQWLSFEIELGINDLYYVVGIVSYSSLPYFACPTIRARIFCTSNAIRNLTALISQFSASSAATNLLTRRLKTLPNAKAITVLVRIMTL